MSTPEIRTNRFSIDIDAPPDAVWRALTTAEGLEAWLVSSATVDPGKTITVDWGNGSSGEATVDVWEPDERVRWGYTPPEPMEPDGVRWVEEWTIQRTGGTTRVTLAHSIPDRSDGDWDGYYGDFERGWTMFLAAMRHWVETARCAPRHTTLQMPTVPTDTEASWAQVLDVVGVTDPAEGDTVTVDGRTARVLVAIPPRSLLLAFEDASTLFADLEGGPDQLFVYALASTFGTEDDAAAAWRSTLVDRFATLGDPVG